MPSDPLRAERLQRLIDDFSYPERRNPELLAKIDALLSEARRAGLLQPGATATEVRTALGPPYRSIGEEHEPTYDWHYPTLPPPDEGRPGDPWVLVLRFRDGVLQAIERRVWREAD